MSRDRSTDLFEKIGVVAIVVSLAFVTYEIRQDTNAIRSTVIHSVSQQSFDAIALLVENEDLRKASFAALSGNATPEERRLVDLSYAALLRIQLNRYLQSEIGVVDKEMVLLAGGRGGGPIYKQPDFRDYWERNRTDYSDEFQAFMAENVLKQ